MLKNSSVTYWISNFLKHHYQCVPAESAAVIDECCVLDSILGEETWRQPSLHCFGTCIGCEHRSGLNLNWRCSSTIRYMMRPHHTSPMSCTELTTLTPDGATSALVIPPRRYTTISDAMPVSSCSVRVWKGLPQSVQSAPSLSVVPYFEINTALPLIHWLILLSERPTCVQLCC